MKRFKLDISLPLPLIKLSYDVTHTDVKKPSGLAYLFLVLLQRSPDKNQTLEEVFSSVGINENLYGIFIEVINDLIEKKIIYTADSGGKFDFNPRNFSRYTLGVFHFTEDGESVFRKKVIPSQTPITDKVEIFYDVANRRFLTSVDDEWKKCINSALDPDFVLGFPIEKDVEEYLNGNKGTGIGIKKEEEISKVEKLSSEAWYKKADCSLAIDNCFSFDFGNQKENSFIKKNYKAELIERILDMKKKFMFKVSYSEIDGNEFAKNNFTNFFFPEDMERLMNEECLATFYSTGYEASGTYRFDCLEDNDNVKFIKLYKNGMAKSFIPARFKLESEEIGTIGINLIGVAETGADLVKKLVDKCTEDVSHSFEDIKEFTSIYCALGEFGAIEARLRKVLDEKARYNLETLKIIKDLFSQPKLQEIYAKLVRDNYIELISDELDDDNYQDLLKDSRWVISGKSFVKQSEALPIIAKKLDDVSKFSLFEELSSDGFEESLVQQVANPIPEVLEKNSSTSDSLDSAIKLFQYSKELRALLKMKDGTFASDFDEETLSRNELSSKIIQCNALLKPTKAFREMNTSIFNGIDQTLKEANRVNDFMNKIASLKTNEITIENVERKIVKGDFQSVLLGLVARLSSFLNPANERIDFIDLLRRGYEQGAFGKEDWDQLNKLRIARNDVAHPERESRTQITADDLRKWSSIVFRIVSKGKEETDK